MPCIVVDGYNKINWNVYFCVAFVRRSFHPSSLLGKFIERGRRHRAIGDGRRLLFNGATTCRQIKIKKWREGGIWRMEKIRFYRATLIQRLPFFSRLSFFPSLKRIERVNIKKKWTETGWIDWIKKRNVTFVSKHSCPCIYDSIESFFFLIKEI